MSKRLMLVAASALAALAFAALPALASAAEPTVDLSAGNNPTFSGTFGTATLTSANGNVTCSGENHVNGKWTTNANNEATTGDIEITFTGCRTIFGPCHTPGQAAEVITTTETVFHLVYIKGFVKTVGALVTPGAGGHFATFECSLFGTVTVNGNGVIGHVSSPLCGGTSTSSTLNFESSAAHVQKYQEIEGSATKFHLTSNLNGGAFTEASEDVTNATSTNANGVTGKLTCP